MIRLHYTIKGENEMAKLVWDQDTKRFYETGIDHCALYVYGLIGSGSSATYGYKNGVAWSGITSISETPEGGETSDIYADNIKYLSLISTENLNVSIEAYTYPDEFAECDGIAKDSTSKMRIYQQKRSKFGLAYRTRIGNDVDGDAHGYKIHIIYGCLASPSDNQYQTVSDSPEAMTFSWEASCTPVEVGALVQNGVEYRPTARIIIDSRDYVEQTDKDNLKALEEYLWGTDGSSGKDPKLPTPAQVYSLLTTGQAA